MTSGDQISVDELLEMQEQPDDLQVTIEAVADRADHVKVTPFDAEGGCQCGLSLIVPKQAIATVTTTGASHLCCGKRLSVVSITFDDSIVADLFAQLATRARAQSPSNPQSHTLPRPPQHHPPSTVPWRPDLFSIVPLPTTPPVASHPTPPYAGYGSARHRLRSHAPVSIENSSHGSFPGGPLRPIGDPELQAHCAQANLTCYYGCADDTCRCLCDCERYYCLGLDPPFHCS